MMNAWCYVKSEYFSPCCLVRVVCCELSSCGVAKTIIIHVDETTVARVRHGTCDARGSWKRIPWSFASLGGLNPQSTWHRPRPGPKLAPSVHTGRACTATDSARKDPRSEEQEMPMCEKSQFRTWHMLVWSIFVPIKVKIGENWCTQSWRHMEKMDNISIAQFCLLYTSPSPRD